MSGKSVSDGRLGAALGGAAVQSHYGGSTGVVGAIESGVWPSTVGQTVAPATTTPTVPFQSADFARQQATRGESLYNQGHFVQAIEHYQQAVGLLPADADIHYMLGMSLWKSGRRQPAEHHLCEAIRLSPRHAMALDAMSAASLEYSNADLALGYSERAMQVAGDDPRIITSHAMALHMSGQSDAAWRLIEPLLKAGIRYTRLVLFYARLAPARGEEPQALGIILRMLDARRIPVFARPSLHFAAAKLLEKMGRYDDAFAQIREGHEAGRRPYDPAHISAWVDRRINYYTPAKLHDLPRASHGNRRPVFIVGMPRSGTSLVEQVLACHPQVHGAGELDLLDQIAGQAARAEGIHATCYPDCLDDLSLRRANRLAGEYIGQLSSLNSQATYVTDKMPTNFMYLGLITVLFPNAHVIHCTRDPLDTCLSCYFTHFTIGQEFAHDLSHLGAFYQDYRRLMEHWKRVNLPMLDVKYEEVVSDLERQTQRMLEFLDLPWDSRCLEFHRNPRPVLTASGDQVRQPIYKSSIGRWRRYEKHLGPLIAAVG